MTAEAVRVSQVERDGRGPATVWFESPVSLLRARPGQFVMLRLTDALDPFLARPYFFARQRLNVAGALEHGLYVEPRGLVGLALWVARAGDTLFVSGPHGRAAALPRGARNLLLAGQQAYLAPLLLFAQDAVARGLSVTLLLGEGAVLPPALVPVEVEVQHAAADRFNDALLDLLPWCDAAVVSLEPAALPRLGGMLRAAGNRRPVAALVWQAVPCATGFCGACAVELRRGGRRLVCADGPALALTELY